MSKPTKTKRPRGTLPCDVDGCEEPANLFAGAFGAGAFSREKQNLCTDHWATPKGTSSGPSAR